MVINQTQKIEYNYLRNLYDGFTIKAWEIKKPKNVTHYITNFYTDNFVVCQSIIKGN